MRFLRAHTEIYSEMASGRPLISNPVWHLKIRASSLQFRASKINMTLARMEKLVKKLMSNPVYLTPSGITWWSIFN